MSIAKDIYDIGKDIADAREEYLKTQAKDEYIQLMQDKLDKAMGLLHKLESELSQYKSVDAFSLDGIHFDILRQFKESKTGMLVDEFLFPKFDDDDRIAFEELIENGYLRKVSTNVYGQTSYVITKDKMVEVLKLLRASKV